MMRAAVAMAVVAAMLCACGGSPPAAPRVAPVPDPVAAPVAAPAPAEPADPLNLGFEAAGDPLPAGWLIGLHENAIPPGATVRGDASAHGGARSLAIQVRPGVRFGAFHRELVPAAVRGKHVRVSGWIKTAAVTGGAAGLWIYTTTPGSPGGQAYVDGSLDGPRGTTDWTAVDAELEVPADATRVVIGGLLATAGQAWFDDLVLEVTPVGAPVVIEGVVRDAAGAPVDGAEVALIGSRGSPTSSHIIDHVTTAGGGAFRFQTRSGRLGLSAHKSGQGGAFLPKERFAADRRGVDLVLPGSGVAVEGKVSVRGGPLASGLFVRVSPLSEHNTDQFAVPVGPDGRFAATLPFGYSYSVYALATDVVGFTSFKYLDDTAAGELVLYVVKPAPPEVAAWIEANALAPTLEPGGPDTELTRFGAMVGKAQVVALGDPAHGVREYTQLHLRLFQYLVAHHGFTLLAIEANLPECRALNEYILHGTGDARSALDGLVLWNWRSAEMLEVVEWMRSWNADPAHRTKIQLVGFDMRVPGMALDNVAAYLRERMPDDAEMLMEPLAALGGERPVASTTTDMVGAVTALVTVFDTNRAAWRKAGPERHDLVRQDLEVLRQTVDDRLTAAVVVSGGRSAALAANLRWHLGRMPRARAMVWAETDEVATPPAPRTSMGTHLRAALGPKYLAAGTVFSEGEFVAKNDTGQGATGEALEFSFGAPPSTDTAAPFAVTGKPLLIADLRRLPRTGVVRDWFHAEHPLRRIGLVYYGDFESTDHLALADNYDLVLYVARLSRTHRF